MNPTIRASAGRSLGAALTLAAVTLTTLSLAAPPTASAQDGEWRYWGADAASSRYSPLDQIDASNFNDLEVAWTWRGDNFSPNPTQYLRATPIYVNGTLYSVAGTRRTAVAIDPATGETLWTFREPHTKRWEDSMRKDYGKGVAYAEVDGRGMIYLVTPAFFMHALDPETGRPIESFGKHGTVDLLANLGHWKHDRDVGLPPEVGYITNSSPPIVVNGVVVVGNSHEQGYYQTMQENVPGNILAYDADTGEHLWTFNVIPQQGEFGNDTWESDAWKHTGNVSAWAPLSADAELGLVYVVTDPPTVDYYGGFHPGDNLFATSILALDVETGERRWHFQTVHHDVWDYDLPAQPALIRMTQNGRTFDAVVQPTKQGFLFFFHRETGRPVWPVEERPIPMSDVGGEQLWPTQPFPVKPRPLSRQGFHAKDISDISEESRAAVKKIWDATDAGDLFTPPSTRGTLVHPGFRGGCLWGGCCYNPAMNRVFASSDETTNRIELKLAPQEAFDYALPDRSEFLDHEGYPAIKPPWGYVTAVDLESGDFAWRVVNGEFAELTAHGIPKTGTPSHGGSIATAGGLVFMAGTFDKKFRAFDQDNGEVLWESELKAGGFATPCTYEADGKQFGVIAAGGGKGNTASGDEIVAFSIDS